ncbi:MAG TPA: YgeY family selenium metabolism-linked hydrolase [Candidatus Eremiobacteraceae bacterium]|nr:YgeY family selenium metabolism-linked hydrolase [Candidatus Eremiobacteraceae bacterium]
MTAPKKTLFDRERLVAAAQACEGEMVHFLRDLIAIPAESSQEGPVIQRIQREMKKVGFDEILVDPMGNILGRIGSGNKIIMMDSHTDTVGVGDRREWAWDPYAGKVEHGYVYGRGACDQRAGMASLVYAGNLIKQLGLEGDYTFYAVGSVQEEDCDGLAWIYLLKEGAIRPDCVVITEPTNLRIYRGHRGRMEIEVHLRGRSCHASAPERGDNPIYKMAPLVQEVEKLNERLRVDTFLGKGTIAVTEIRSVSPSLCAVPAACSMHLDRRLTAGETKESSIAEVRALLDALQLNAEVEVPEYKTSSYTGLVYPMEKYYPTWVLEEAHPLVQAGVRTYQALHGKPPVVDKWTFSTNGVGSMGVMRVPTIGFGPGEEDVAHTVNERVAIRHLVEAAEFYAAFPLVYASTVKQDHG